MGDELLRRRLESLRLRGADPAPGWPRQRFKVINGGHLPTAVPRVFWGVPLGPVIGASTPAEGGVIASSAPADSEAQPIVVIGPEAPAVGKELLAWRVNDQWVADYGENAAVAGPVERLCSCDIPTSKQLYYTKTVSDPRPFFVPHGTYPLTYTPAPGYECIPGLVPFRPWGEGWYYRDSSIVICFTPSCDVAACSVGFGAAEGSLLGSKVSCEPVLVIFSGILITGTVHE